MPETESDIPPEGREPQQTRTRLRRTIEVWLGIARQTLREPILRFAGHFALLAVIALGVWAARVGLDTLPADAARSVETSTELLQATVTVASIQELEGLPPFSGGPLTIEGVTRVADVHTIFPTRPRFEVIKYIVQKGDHLFGISEKFGIKPETLLWSNYDVLEDNPHGLKEGQELNIPPVDGTMYTWHAGDGLNGVADFFGVTPQDIVDWPGNDLDPGIDLSNPTIEPGTLLMIPGGRRELVTWSAPRITRSNPAVAKLLGPGACGSVYDGPVGSSSFVWPTPGRTISGYHYDPSFHPAIDIGGSTGSAIYGSDSGVVVYSGWNDWGYGLVIVLDHGNGWQTLYAHLSQINVVCGQAVFQGNIIGLMGCTGNCSGPHLHFEMMHDVYGKVNPLNFLP
jgi:murein DD-endopeptidase MepM/ murein hydrolase activator NlpD